MSKQELWSIANVLLINLSCIWFSSRGN